MNLRKWNTFDIYFFNDGKMLPIIYASCIAMDTEHCFVNTLFPFLFETHLKVTQSC